MPADRAAWVVDLLLQLVTATAAEQTTREGHARDATGQPGFPGHLPTVHDIVTLLPDNSTGGCRLQPTPPARWTGRDDSPASADVCGAGMQCV